MKLNEVGLSLGREESEKYFSLQINPNIFTLLINNLLAVWFHQRGPSDKWGFNIIYEYWVKYSYKNVCVI